jgi:hypothetical protein
MNTIELPIYWTQHFKTKNDKTVLVGMNWYRNAHFHAQNAMKKHFHELVSTQVGNKNPQVGKFNLAIEIYYKNSNCDGANIAALIEKFVLDALQEEKVIINDNVQYHKGSSWKVVDQDKDNPRCLISIIEQEQE